jgi:hypothetical protein
MKTAALKLACHRIKLAMDVAASSFYSAEKDAPNMMADGPHRNRNRSCAV